MCPNVTIDNRLERGLFLVLKLHYCLYRSCSTSQILIASEPETGI